MTVDIHRVRTPELEEAGRITALSYREFAPARPEDSYACEPEGWWPYLSKLADVAARHQRTTVLVAVDAESGAMQGTITLETDARIDPTSEPPEGDELHIRMLGVAPAARGCGVGRALMDAALELAREQQRRHITLHTTERMTAAQNLYTSLGFRRGPDETMGDGEKLLSFELDLGSLPATG